MTEDTRSRILASALTLIGEHGYSGMSIRQIAESLGITKAAVHYHFGAKEQIAHALVDPALSRVDGLLASGETDAAALMHGFAAAVATFGPTMHLLVSDPSVREIAGVDGRIKTQMRRFLEALSPDPAGRLRATAALGALQFGAMAAAANGKIELLAPPADDAELAARLDVVVSAALAALRS